MPLLMFILGAAVVNIIRFLSTGFKVAALPLTQEEFNDATKNMSLLECLQFFENFISYKMFGITFFYKGFTNGNSSEELILLLCLIYNKYKDVDNEKIKKFEVPNILEPHFVSEYNTFDEFTTRYGIITDIETTDYLEECMNINKIRTLVKSLCDE